MKLAKVYDHVPGLDEALLVEDYAEMFDDSVEEIMQNIQRRRTLGKQHNGDWYVEAPPFYISALERVNQRRIIFAQQQEKQSRKNDSNKSSNATTNAPKNAHYYGRILDLKGRVSFEDIKRRYRELVAQYHPDKVSHLGPKLKAVAENEIKEINEAFQFFRNENRK